MKRTRLLILLLILGLSHLPLFAQDSTTASAIAEKQEAEERYKRLSADVESLLAANASLQKKISALDAELQKVREDQLRSANNNNNDAQETVKKLADAIQEVDKNRENDKKQILKEIADLGKKLSIPPPTRSKPVASEESNPGPDKGYPYVIQSGDTLLAVLADFNAQFKAKGMKPIKMDQVMAANPNVDWKKLKIGQKIFIPAPE
jgi:TolA-binding protein